MSQIAVRFLEAVGANSSEDTSGLRTFFGIALGETADTAGCWPFGNNADSKSGHGMT